MNALKNIKYTTVRTNKAEAAWQALNGVACIFKPVGRSIKQVQETIKSLLCADLNDMEDRPSKQIVNIIGSTNEPMDVRLETSLADHILVVGPRYQMNNVKCSYATHLSSKTSGVLLLGINGGTRDTMTLNMAKLTRAYKLHGVLGKATDTYFADGKVVERSTHKHIKRENVDDIVAYMQAQHQKKMYEMSGAHMESQLAYKLALKGPIRPAVKDLPVFYGMKCVHFENPNFVIEVQCINEYEKYLHTIIHDIGIQLKSTAHCTRVLCIRHGMFTLDHALLSKHWTLEYILNSIAECRKLIKKHERVIRKQEVALQHL